MNSLHLYSLQKVGGHVLRPEKQFPGRDPQELSQTEVMRDEILDLLEKLKTKCLGSHGIPVRFLMELRCETADVLTSICNLHLNSARGLEDSKCYTVFKWEKTKQEITVSLAYYMSNTN